MMDIYKNNYLTILKNNQHCDQLAASEKYNLSNIPLDHIGLPSLLFKYNNSIFTSIISGLNSLYNNIYTTYLTSHQKKRTEWFFSTLSAHPLL